MYKNENIDNACQIRCLPKFYCGNAEVPPESFLRKMRLKTRRRLEAPQVRKIKTNLQNLIDKILGATFKKEYKSYEDTDKYKSFFKKGDIVRVRSKDEIKKTLNLFGQLKGCMFMPEMIPYCDTKQKVLKPLERFVDERDYQVKKCKGIVLLEGLNCEGTSDYGRCDRSCYYFWREEWLEKIQK